MGAPFAGEGRPPGAVPAPESPAPPRRPSSSARGPGRAPLPGPGPRARAPLTSGTARRRRPERALPESPRRPAPPTAAPLLLRSGYGPPPLPPPLTPRPSPPPGARPSDPHLCRGGAGASVSSPRKWARSRAEGRRWLAAEPPLRSGHPAPPAPRSLEPGSALHPSAGSLRAGAAQTGRLFPAFPSAKHRARACRAQWLFSAPAAWLLPSAGSSLLP